MQETESSASKRTAPKRLARAKAKRESRTDTKVGADTTDEAKPKSKAQRRRELKERIVRIGIGVFAVIMALSMMLPSLSYIFGSVGDQQAQQVEEDVQDDQEATDEDQTEPSGLEAVDSAYEASIASLEERHEQNKSDLATLLSLGSTYMAWGNEASMYASDEDASAHVSELYDKAIAAFDEYLSLNDSVAVEVERALCQVYGGSSDEGIAGLEKISQEHADYAPVWMNLGRIYEVMGTTEDAKAAYEKAVEADPDDSYGAKSYANTRLASMAKSAGGELTSDDDVKADLSEDTGAAALERALTNN